MTYPPEEAPSRLRNVFVMFDHGCLRNLREIFDTDSIDTRERAYHSHISPKQTVLLSIIDIENRRSGWPVFRQIFNKLNEGCYTHAIICSSRGGRHRIIVRRKQHPIVGRIFRVGARNLDEDVRAFKVNA